MSEARSEAERRIYEGYVWPGTDVYRNKLGLKDPAELDQAEAKYAAARAHTRPKFKDFDLAEMQAVHKHLLDPVYEWAGNVRDYTTGRGPIPFARPEHIESYVGDLARQLKREDHLKGTDADQFSKRAAHYANEINAAHPFVDGNGRVTRLFVADLAEQAGYKFDIEAVEAKKGAWYAAMKEGFESGNPDRLAQEIRSALHRPQDLAAAQAFRQAAPEQALQDHPDLAGSYATLAGIVKQARAEGLTARDVAAVAGRVRENIAKSIERGERTEPPDRTPAQPQKKDADLDR